MGKKSRAWRRCVAGSTALFATVTAILACSGAPDNAFTSAPADTDAGASSSGSSGGPGASSSGMASSASSSGSTSSSSSSSGMTTLDSGLMGDGGQFGPGGNTTTIPCGAMTCPLASGGACCIRRLPDNTFATSCAPAGGACPALQQTVTLRCASSVNCGFGTTCCITEPTAGPPFASECRTFCSSTQDQMCDPSGVFSGCAIGTMCTNRDARDLHLPSVYNTCK